MKIEITLYIKNITIVNDINIAIEKIVNFFINRYSKENVSKSDRINLDNKIILKLEFGEICDQYFVVSMLEHLLKYENINNKICIVNNYNE